MYFFINKKGTISDYIWIINIGEIIFILVDLKTISESLKLIWFLKIITDKLKGKRL